MTEYGYVEEAMLEWLSGKDGDPNDHGLGWTYRTEDEMEVYGRVLTDAVVEALLVPAIMRINPVVDTEAKARKAVDALRNLMRTPDPLDANRRTLEALRDGVPLVLESGQDAITVKFIEFDPERQHLNDFTVTNQYRVRGSETVKADTVLLVNGIPVVLAEYKSYVNSGHDWTEGVNQLHRYQREAPALLVPNVFSVSADEQEFRYGPVAFEIKAQRDIDLQRDDWKPWLSQYPAKRLYWDAKPEDRDPDQVKAATEGLLRPCNVLDFIENFHTFETKRGKMLPADGRSPGETRSPCAVDGAVNRRSAPQPEGEGRGVRYDHAGEAARGIPLRPHRHAHRQDDGQHAPGLRPC